MRLRLFAKPRKGLVCGWLQLIAGREVELAVDGDQNRAGVADRGRLYTDVHESRSIQIVRFKVAVTRLHRVTSLADISTPPSVGDLRATRPGCRRRWCCLRGHCRPYPRQ